MSFWSDIGDTVKRTFSNPAKLAGDISLFGIPAIGRLLPKAFGGGQSGIFAKSSEVAGGTAIGVVTGFATGGPAGAFVGGATGFGRGVAGVVHGDSGSAIAGGSAKYAAITGSLTGAVKGIALARTGQAATYFSGPNAAGIVGKGSNALYADIFSKTLAQPVTAGVNGTQAVAGTAGTPVSAFGSLSKGLETVVPLALLKSLQGNSLLPGTGAGSTGVTLNSTGPGPATTAPSQGPNLYPGVPSGLQTVAAATPGTDAALLPTTQNTWLYAGLALLVLILSMKKKRHG